MTEQNRTTSAHEPQLSDYKIGELDDEGNFHLYEHSQAKFENKLCGFWIESCNTKPQSIPSIVVSGRSASMGGADGGEVFEYRLENVEVPARERERQGTWIFAPNGTSRICITDVNRAHELEIENAANRVNISRPSPCPASCTAYDIIPGPSGNFLSCTSDAQGDIFVEIVQQGVNEGEGEGVGHYYLHPNSGRSCVRIPRPDTAEVRWTKVVCVTGETGFSVSQSALDPSGPNFTILRADQPTITFVTVKTKQGPKVMSIPYAVTPRKVTPRKGRAQWMITVVNKAEAEVEVWKSGDPGGRVPLAVGHAKSFFFESGGTPSLNWDSGGDPIVISKPPDWDTRP